MSLIIEQPPSYSYGTLKNAGEGKPCVQVLFLHLWLCHICNCPVGKSNIRSSAQSQCGWGLPNDLDAGSGIIAANLHT